MWRVISKMKFFGDLSYDNALKDVMALTSPDVMNTVIVEKGEYWVAAQADKKKCIEVNSNTTLIIDGTIKLRPNDLGSYNIIFARGHDIEIQGRGTIVGDKHTHLGEKGEWGMGINLNGVQRAVVMGSAISSIYCGSVIVRGNKLFVEDVNQSMVDIARSALHVGPKYKAIEIEEAKNQKVSGNLFYKR